MTKAFSKVRHSVVTQDHVSSRIWTYFLSEKSESANVLEELLSDTRTDGSVEILRIPRETEFNGLFQAICKRLDIARELTSPLNARLIGCVERGVARRELMS